jgi:hypothetical protein
VLQSIVLVGVFLVLPYFLVEWDGFLAFVSLFLEFYIERFLFLGAIF